MGSGWDLGAFRDWNLERRGWDLGEIGVGMGEIGVEGNRIWDEI